VKRTVKRRIAVVFLAVVAGLIASTLALLRTQWAGEQICALAEAKVTDAIGLPISLARCSIDPIRLEVTAEQIKVGSADAPIFSADWLRARLAPVQALGRRIHIDEVAAGRPRIHAKLPRLKGRRTAEKGPCPPPLLEQFELRRLRVEEGALELTLPGGEHLSVQRFDVSSEMVAPRRSLLRLASPTRTTSLGIQLGPSSLAAGGKSYALQSGRVDVDVLLDLSRIELRGAHMEGEGIAFDAAGNLEGICSDSASMAMAMSARAPLAALFALAGRQVDAEGVATLKVDLLGTPAQPVVEGELKLEKSRIGALVPGDASVRFNFDGRSVTLHRVEVPIGEGQVVVTGKLDLTNPAVGANLEVKTRDAELAQILDRAGVHGAYVFLKATTEGRVSGTLRPLILRGEADIQVADFKVLSQSWERWQPGAFVALEAARGRVVTSVAITPESVRMPDARVTVGAGTVIADADLQLNKARGFTIDAKGTVDLTELKHIAGIPWSGTAQIEAKLRAAPYGAPHIEGKVEAAGLRFHGMDLGETNAKAVFDTLDLRFSEIQGARGETRYGGELTLGLTGKEVPRMDGLRGWAQGRIRDLLDMTEGWLPYVRHARPVIDGQVALFYQAAGPLPGVDIDFDARLGEGTLLGHPYDSGRFKGKVVEARQVVSELVELRRGRGGIQASGQVGFVPPHPWKVDLSFHGAQLEELSLPGGPYSGKASGSVALTGSIEQPSGRLALSGEGIWVRGVPLGAVQAGGILKDKRLNITGSFLDGARFTGNAQITGDMPYQARAEVELDDVSELFPGGAPAGLSAEARGVATASGVLADLSASRAHLHFDRLRGGYADFKVNNRDPVVISLDRGRVEVRSFTLRGDNTEFSLVGTRDANGALDFRAAGTLDLRLLSGVAPALTRPHGQLSMEATISGTYARPLMVGAGRIQEAGFRLAGVQMIFDHVTGDLAFSQNRVLFDDMGATLNGGRLDLRGEIELRHFLPSRLRIDGLLDEVPMRVPETIPSVVTGELSLWGPPETLTLQGKLDLIRARYTEKVELERSFLEFRRRHGLVAKVYDKSGEWLNLDVELRVEGDVSVDNDVMRGGVRGKVNLVGNVGAVGLLGTLTATPNSRAFFRGNEFTLTHAVVDFTERNRILANFDVHGDSAIRDYRVYMHAFGTLDDPHLQLTSAPALSQPDIVTLLSLGFTSQDAAGGSGVGGAATAAAQALFSVSGLDSQVKRFLPREGLFRDLSVRITSSYSQGSGQVEPRAEFESKVLHERLRLRYQAPLSGARGQRAQAEIRLNDRASLQYQWDNDNPDVTTVGDHGFDLKLRWEWVD
jgi:translocation and assembly module TamB